MTCKHGLDRELIDCLQCENEELRVRLAGDEAMKWNTQKLAAYPRLVLALRNLADAPTDDNGAAVRIELRRTARLLLAELGELKVCQHGSGRITPDGWMCSACGEVFMRESDRGIGVAHATVPDLSPAHAWPDIPDFLKRKTS